MRLIVELESRIAGEESLFRAQLLREDVARLRKLRELAVAAADRETLEVAARRLGWTQGEQRTHELHAALGPLFDAVFAFEHGDTGEASEQRIHDAWVALTRERVERLVGCLSTPVPKP